MFYHVLSCFIMFSIFNLLYQELEKTSEGIGHSEFLFLLSTGIALGLSVWLDFVSRTAPLLLAQWKVSSRWGLRKSLSLLDGCAFPLNPSLLLEFLRKTSARLLGTLFHTWLATTRLEWLPSPTMICIRSLFARGKDKFNFDPDWHRSWIGTDLGFLKFTGAT